jgi:hypothetical protein
MHEEHALRLSVTREMVTRLLVATGLANIVLMVGTYFSRAWSSLDWRVAYFGGQLNLAAENNMAAWYAAMLLLVLAVVMLLCFVVDRQAESRSGSLPQGGTLLTYGWLLLAFLFAGLSLDELGSLHERLTETPAVQAVLPRLDVSSVWVGVLAIPMAVVGLSMFAFAWFRVRASRTAFLLMTAGVLLLLSVAAHENLESSMRDASGLGTGFARPAILGVLEEGSELFGTFLILAAGLAFVRRRSVGEEIVVHVRRGHVMTLAAIVVLGMLTIHVLLPMLVSLHGDHRGVTRNWFPAALAMLASICCFVMIARDQRAVAGSVVAPLLVLGIVNLLLSLDHGSNHRYTEWFFSNRPTVSFWRDVVFSLGVVGSAAFFVSRVSERGARAAVIGWAVLLLIALHTAGDVRTIVPSGAYLVLLYGLRTLLPLARA